MYAFFIQILIRLLSISIIMAVFPDWEKPRKPKDMNEASRDIERRNLLEGIWNMVTRLTTEDIREILRYTLQFHIEPHELYTVPIPGFVLTENGWHSYQNETHDYEMSYIEWLRKESERHNLCLAIIAKSSRFSLDDLRSVYAYTRTFNPPQKTPHY
jgi:hypothetical protein